MTGFFVQRLLTFTFGLGTGDYGAGTPNKFSLTAHERGDRVAAVAAMRSVDAAVTALHALAQIRAALLVGGDPAVLSEQLVSAMAAVAAALPPAGEA